MIRKIAVSLSFVITLVFFGTIASATLSPPYCVSVDYIILDGVTVYDEEVDGSVTEWPIHIMMDLPFYTEFISTFTGPEYEIKWSMESGGSFKFIVGVKTNNELLNGWVMLYYTSDNSDPEGSYIPSVYWGFPTVHHGLGSPSGTFSRNLQDDLNAVSETENLEILSVGFFKVYGECIEECIGTGTPGYWKNHPEAWTVDEIIIGGVTYPKSDAIDLMKSKEKKDKTFTMFSALVAAKLNVIIGNDDSCIADIIAAADAWMSAHPVGSNVKAGGKNSFWRVGELLYLDLDAYNNGLLCAPSRDICEDGDDDLECDCSGKVTWLTLQYNGTEAADIKVEQKKSKETVFEGNDVEPGDQFTFVGNDKKGTLGTEISIFVGGNLNTKIHTSCSKPIGPGLISGDFEVIAGSSRNGGLLCPVPAGKIAVNKKCKTCRPVAKTATQNPVSFSLVQNYPNPFNPITTISFTLPHSSYVTLKIYNFIGENITTLVNSEFSAGIHSVEWNAREFSSGIYFYRIEAGPFVETKRMLFIK